MKKLLLALQVYSGDIAEGEQLLKVLLDIHEGTRIEEADIALVTRFDCRPFDTKIVGRLHEHFSKVWTRKTKRKEIGYPAGSNGMWHDVMWWVYEMHKSFVMDYEAVLTTEADACPLSKSWSSELLKEFRDSKKKVCGYWHESGPAQIGHINGNAMFDPCLVEEDSSLMGCSYDIPWDFAHARLFERLGWHKSSKIHSAWNAPTLSEEVIDSLADSGIVWLHGVKDASSRVWAAQNLR